MLQYALLPHTPLPPARQESIAVEFPLLQLHPSDSVAVALCPLSAATRARLDANSGVTLTTAVPAGHKVALRSIDPGQPILKYGQPIGLASQPISPGDWVHTHNVQPELPPAAQWPSSPQPSISPSANRHTFQGFRRANGRVGTRNYVAIVCTVNCSASTARFVVQQVSRDLLDRFPGVDGVFAVTHKGGCAFGEGSADHRQLVRVLSGIASHPNVGGSLILGLGCEAGQPGYLLQHGGLVSLSSSSDGRAGAGAGDAPATPPVLTIQEQGGIRKTVDAALAALEPLLAEVATARRTAVPLSELILATECGGSDSLSGITANPIIGGAADRLIDAGGTAILSETPEIIGGEHLLAARAVTSAVRDALLERVRFWHDLAAKFGETVNNNPSAGNKQGGLTTIFEKSLGAILKGGTRPLTAVYQYADRVTERGFVFMDTPGFDPASVTGMLAGGAQVVVFSTGRGSCFGSKPAPTIKVASNSGTFHRMQDDMDFNAGELLAGRSLSEMADELLSLIVAVASGQTTASERLGLGDEEFCPWQVGPVF